MFQITILFLYVAAAAALGSTRFPQFAERTRALVIAAFVMVTIGVHLHLRALFMAMSPDGTIAITLTGAVSLIGLQLALIALVAAFEPPLRGLAAGLLALGGAAALATLGQDTSQPGALLTWQMKTHVLLSMFAYGLLTAGAIVAVYALVQDRRLKRARVTAISRLFAPLYMTERVLYGVATAGFAALALSVVSGFTFVENLFAQHLVHKTALSLLALAVFGILLGGRYFAGWRGQRGVWLYLGGFALLILAYFGSRFILEVLLGRSWS